MATILAEADAAKAVTADDGSMVHIRFPITKSKDTESVNPVDGTPDIEIWGKVTDGTLDSDLQIVDPAASLEWIRKWHATKSNIRLGHDPKRPIGRGLEIDGHNVRALICEPTAKHLIRNKVLQDWSVGIINPDIRKGDPRFQHLDPTGKAVNGIITDRADGLTELGEISAVDRGSNYGTAFQMVKAVAGGGAEWVGKMVGAPAATKDRPAKVYKTVSVDFPAGSKITVDPSVLAKMNTIAKRNAVAAVGVTKVAEPAEPAAVTDADPPGLAAIKAAEAAVYKRDIGTATRRRLASEGHALPDGSYPIENAGDLHNAAVLARSGHGDVPAATALIAREARRLKVPNPMKPAKGKKAKATKATVPDAPAGPGPAVVKVAACDACKDTGAADGRPCTACPEGKKAASAQAALDKAVAGIVPEPLEKKRKVMCGHCGAKQNAKHAHCPECGNALYPGAMPVNKNHEFACLNCGHDPLDKGEPHCPGCGAENPGYLPQADHQIPSNKANKERVGTDDVTKAKGGKKAGKGKKGKGKPFGGSQAPAFGKPGDGDADDAKDAKKSAAPVAAKGRKGKKGRGGKGRSPAQGAVSQETMGLPPHREPDGPAVDAFEADAGMSGGDAEMKAALRHKAACPDPELAALHDLTCPAFRPADVAKSVPWASFASLDEGRFTAQALEAASGGDLPSAMAKWNEMAALGRHALTLKAAGPQLLHDIAVEQHQAFLAANKSLTDAVPGPGPGSVPTPSVHWPGQFARPYLTAGHAAPSPMHDGPHSFPVAHGTPVAQDFGHGYLTAGHAMDSPANGTPRHEPVAPPSDAGRPGRMDTGGTMRDNARQARVAMHDHVSRLFPDICPMSPDLADAQKPAPPVPQAVGAPAPHPAGAPKAARAAQKARRAKKAAKAAARKADARRARVQRQVLKGALTVDEGRAKLGLKPFAVPETAVPPAPQEPAAPQVPGADAIAKAVAAPLEKRLKAQGKLLRKSQKYLDAMASQGDTSGAPFRGAGVTKSATTTSAPAGPVTAAESAAQAQTAKMQRLYKEWRTTDIPEHQEAAWNELQAMLGTTPMTGYGDDMIPLRQRHPYQPQT